MVGARSEVANSFSSRSASGILPAKLGVYDGNGVGAEVGVLVGEQYRAEQ